VKLPACIGEFARRAGFHLTARAAVLLAAGAAAVVVFRGPAASWAAVAWGAAWLAAVAADVLRSPRPTDLTWRRDLPPKLSIGVANPVTVAIGNPTGAPVTLRARETPPPSFAGERAFGPLTVPPHEEVEVALAFTPPARGLFYFGDVGVRTTGPLGLAGRAVRVPLRQEAKVYPDIVAVRSYALLARKGALAEMGIKRMRLAGEGTEFESLREYPKTTWRMLPWMIRGDDGFWRLPPGYPEIPLQFSLSARKPG